MAKTISESKRAKILNGNLFQAILMLAIPVMINSFIQSMYNLTDTFWLGRIGTENQLQILIKIYLPMCMPALATILLFATVANWNCWMDGYLYMNMPNRYPLQTYLATILMESKINIETRKARHQRPIHSFSLPRTI